MLGGRAVLSASASYLNQNLVAERSFLGGTIVTPGGTQLPLAGLGALGEGEEAPAAGGGPSARPSGRVFGDLFPLPGDENFC